MNKKILKKIDESDRYTLPKWSRIQMKRSKLEYGKMVLEKYWHEYREANKK